MSRHIEFIPMKKGVGILGRVSGDNTWHGIKNHLKAAEDETLYRMLEEMKQLRTLREVEKNGERAFQVAAK